MFKNFLTIISLLFIQFFMTANADDTIRVNNRVIASQWISSVNKNIATEEAQTIAWHVFEQAKRHKIDPLLVLSIIKSESTFYKNAKSHMGARGLMQVMPRWHRDKIKGRNILDISVNIEVGVTIINDCLKNHSDNVRRALRCYLGGDSSKYIQKISTTHRELHRALLLDMFEKERNVHYLASFDKPRQYHETLAQLETNTILLASNNSYFN